MPLPSCVTASLPAVRAIVADPILPDRGVKFLGAPLGSDAYIHSIWGQTGYQKGEATRIRSQAPLDAGSVASTLLLRSASA